MVVGNDVIELRGWLVVPRTPGLPAVDADGRALIDGDGDDVGILWIDPDGVIVVAPRSAFDGCETLPRVGGAIGRSVGDVNHIFILGIDADTAEVVASSPDAFFVVDELPALAGVVGTIDAASFLRVHPRIHAIGIAGRNSLTNTADTLRRTRQSFGELLPVVSTVCRFVESAACSGITPTDRPHRTARGPHAGEDCLRIARIESEVHASNVFVFVENFLKRLSTVKRTEDATLGIRAVRMALGRDEEAIGIFGIDDDGCDLLRIAQACFVLTKMCPGRARVRRFVDTVSDREIGTTQAFSAADVDDVWIRRRDRNGADGACGLIIEDRIPSAAKVSRLPDSAVVRRHVENVRLSRDASDRHRATAAKGTDRSPVKFLVHRRIVLLAGKRGRENKHASRYEQKPEETLVHNSPSKKRKHKSRLGRLDRRVSRDEQFAWRTPRKGRKRC